MEMTADMLTKGLPTGTFNKLRKMIGLEVCSGSGWGGVLTAALLLEHNSNSILN